MQTLLVEITAASTEEAERIGRTLVEEGLASCANIVAGMRSIYRWQGRVEEASETLLLAKTTEAALPALSQRVRALHSYECPCVAAVQIAGGNPEYLAWIEAECARPLVPSVADPRHRRGPATRVQHFEFVPISRLGSRGTRLPNS